MPLNDLVADTPDASVPVMDEARVSPGARPWPGQKIATGLRLHAPVPSVDGKINEDDQSGLVTVVEPGSTGAPMIAR